MNMSDATNKYDILDGRNHLYQWDTGRTVSFPQSQAVEEVHIPTGQGLIKRTLQNGILTIPDLALQQEGPLILFLVQIQDGRYTKQKVQIDVYPRPKPADYIDPPEESSTIDLIIDRLQQQVETDLNFTPTINQIKQTVAGLCNDITAFQQTSSALSDSIDSIRENEAELSGTVNGMRQQVASLSNTMDDLKDYLGYSDGDVIGLEADFQNSVFTHLGGATGLNPGTDFDRFPMYGERKRCNVADNGSILAWYGDAGFKEDGSNGQVMVYQPKFYYRVVPVKLDPIATGIGHHLRKARYYLSAIPKPGFLLHPAFYDEAGNEVSYILYSAYEGCLYDTSSGAYNQTDVQTMDAAADKLSSIAGVKPVSGLVQAFTRTAAEQMAQNRGKGWHIDTIKAVSAQQLLMMLEYGTLQLQLAFGKGVSQITDIASYNCASLTGSTSSLGNTTGNAVSTINEKGGVQTAETDNGKVSVSYRGVENPFGNIWKLVDGVNFYGNGTMGGGQPFLCSDFNFAESKSTGNYLGAGFTLTNANGYVSAMGYSRTYDWLFLPSETLGNSSSPVGDYVYVTPNMNSYRICRFGGYWYDTSSAGGFSWNATNSPGAVARSFSARLIRIPTKEDI